MVQWENTLTKACCMFACTTTTHTHTHTHKNTHREIKSNDDSCVVCLKGQIALVGQFTNTNADTNKRGTLHISLQFQRKNLHHLGLPKLMINAFIFRHSYSNYRRLLGAEEETPSLSRFTTMSCSYSAFVSIQLKGTCSVHHHILTAL